MSTILVIEDDSVVRENLEEILSFKGYNVISSENGQQGLAMAKKRNPDLIISDIMMPEMDGYDLVKTMREDYALQDIPVILLTAKTMTDSKIRGLEIGADDYITKPFESKELLARVNNLIERRKQIKARALLESRQTTVESTDDIFMRNLLDFFLENIENSHFAIEDVVSEMGLSKSTIQRRVKNITDKTFNQLLREFRLEQAKQILEQKGGNISEVAYSVGFNSISYFSFSFKNYFGFPPNELIPRN
ncbi:response regulator transcription factor [Salibacter halophilus]|jgi:DNA-binding response OmpR family regulator|uniref:histidine kinase n=1 Tax=Salibacter halophilus TaxID=1803916 RepID=A0A6N6MAD3_9FLAO|nr:response regulator [Salibacter halophilus]KAB1064035.1 response regulator [Salibacter halophilus]